MHLVLARPGTRPGPRVQLLASASRCRGRCGPSELLAADWGVAADVWSVTSWNELRRDGAGRRPREPAHPGRPGPAALRRPGGWPSAPTGRWWRSATTCGRCRTSSARWVPGELHLAGHRRLRASRTPAGALRRLLPRRRGVDHGGGAVRCWPRRGRWTRRWPPRPGTATACWTVRPRTRAPAWATPSGPAGPGRGRRSGDIATSAQHGGPPAERRPRLPVAGCPGARRRRRTASSGGPGDLVSLALRRHRGHPALVPVTCRRGAGPGSGWWSRPGSPRSSAGCASRSDRPPRLRRGVRLRAVASWPGRCQPAADRPADPDRHPRGGGAGRRRWPRPGDEPQLREAVLLYSREVAFAPPQVYAAAAEARGAWDARLEALVIDALLRDEVDEDGRGRGPGRWAGVSAAVVVVVGHPRAVRRAPDVSRRRGAAPRPARATAGRARRRARATGCGGRSAAADDPLAAGRAFVRPVRPPGRSWSARWWPTCAAARPRARERARRAAAPPRPGRTRPGRSASDDLLPERALGGDTAAVARLLVAAATSRSPAAGGDLLATLGGLPGAPAARSRRRPGRCSCTRTPCATGCAGSAESPASPPPTRAGRLHLCGAALAAWRPPRDRCGTRGNPPGKRPL